MLEQLPFWKILAPLKWVGSFFFDQTQVEASGEYIAGWAGDHLPVENKGNRRGLMQFALTTRSKKPVEITRVQIKYAAPFQLKDPEQRGFFTGGAGTFDETMPFQMTWAGNTSVVCGVKQVFALEAAFDPSSDKVPVQIIISANRLHTSLGNFQKPGQTQITVKDFRACLTSEKPLGIMLPPKCSATSPQPFLIESLMKIRGEKSEGGKIVIHQRQKDGAASTTNIEL